MPTDLTIALAGHAPNRASNITHLLEDFLHLPAPDEKGYYDKPDRWSSITFYALLTDGQVPAGLKPALNLAISIGDPEVGDVKVNIITDSPPSGDILKWTKVADSVEGVDDPIAHLVSALSGSPRPYLMINWDESDADDEELIKQAHAAGKIRVSDLAKGLVEIVPDDDEEEEPEQEPEPDPGQEEPRKRTRRRPQELEEPEEDLEEEPPAKREEPQVTPASTQEETLEEEIAAAARQQTMQSAIAVGTIAVASEALREILNQVSHASFYLQAQDTANAARQLDDVRWAPLTLDVMAAEEALGRILQQAEPYEDVVKATEKTPAKTAKSQERKRVVWDEDAGEWKPAGRGRTRRGVRVGWQDADGNVTEEA